MDHIFKLKVLELFRYDFYLYFIEQWRNMHVLLL